MNTRFDNKLILPRGVLGPTTLLQLPPDDRQSVERWHRKEWAQFVAEIKAHKQRVADKYRDAVLWHREHCIACKAMKSLKRQRGSILLSAFGIIKEAQQDCSFTASTISNLSDFAIFGSAYTHARLHSDGDWYANSGTTSWGSSLGTWQGGCAVADYDTRWNTVSGDAPNDDVSGSNGVWHAGSTSAALGYRAIAINGDLFFGNFSLECRDGTTLTLLFTDTFSMDCEAESLK